MEVLGRIKMIGAINNVSPTFRNRQLVVTTEEQYPQHISIEFTQDKCDLLNQFQIGEQVRVGINLRGREWINPQGETRYFNSIQGWKIDRPQQMQQPQQGYAQSQQNNIPSYGGNQNYGQSQQGYTNTGYHGNGSATNAYFNQNQQQNNGFATPPNSNNGPDDDLPF